MSSPIKKKLNMSNPIKKKAFGAFLEPSASIFAWPADPAKKLSMSKIQEIGPKMIGPRTNGNISAPPPCSTARLG